uniref:NADH-ubiquinone oxidoreductase chain 2 n=1 Tax=Serranus annularis TaxID=2969294 RepID=A0AA96C3Y0_9TELE|nr:NADH dehydrogenase subunit 2 [Serranus annularis]
MFTHTMTLFLVSVGIGTVLTCASTNWVLAWMGLEIGSLAILPLLSGSFDPRTSEAGIKYFLVQSTGAALMLFASATNAFIAGQWHIDETSHIIPVTLATLALALKIGLAPLHGWLPEVISGLDLMTGVLVSTWQKLAPFAMLLQISYTHSPLLIAIGLMSMLVGGWGGINQTQLRKVLAYSSIAHLGWMIMVLQFSPGLSLLALFLYFIMTFSAFLVFHLTRTLNIKSLAISWSKNPTITALLPLLLLSLAGLPPLAGFASKWLILQEFSTRHLYFFMLMASYTTLFNLFYYTRLSYTMTFTKPPDNALGFTPWRIFSFEMTLPLAFSIVATIFLAPLMPTLTAWLSI